MAHGRIVQGKPVAVGQLSDVRAVSAAVRAVGIIDPLVLQDDSHDVIEVEAARSGR
jgi:hypothetical protein